MSPALQEVLALAIFGGALGWTTWRWVRRRKVRDCPACVPSALPRDGRVDSLSVLPPRS